MLYFIGHIIIFWELKIDNLCIWFLNQILRLGALGKISGVKTNPNQLRFDQLNQAD